VWSWGPQIAVNLVNAGATVAQTREARAACEASVANDRRSAHGAFQQVEDEPAALH
jgi:outer membrane protein TolC